MFAAWIEVVRSLQVVVGGSSLFGHAFHPPPRHTLKSLQSVNHISAKSCSNDPSYLYVES